ncbi:Putative 115 kDa protein in type-1 retrotransposable element R1DM [Eumeta japonica]|uniref:115 kDa protein in type-1 retrotransposable element R1DM n=1 Tax=Eumeta variegata TaxID=151549 RepID=A0A4C2ABF7_EUMVA|nr:Putative 115 kDa protein in type-1 retrotransposable element R1DM [Eumeta japonica]
MAYNAEAADAAVWFHATARDGGLLYDLMTHIHNELNLKRIIVMVSLDIEGAFDNAWWPALRNQLLVHKCPVNLYGMVMGYLRDREAFADDVVLMFSGQSASALEAETNRALAHVRDWGDRNKLRSYNRQGLTFIPHVAKACKRAASIYKGIARAAKATWGLSPEIVRTIYVAAIEPIVTYASCAGPRQLKARRKMLDALQRSVALKACRAYRTVSPFRADPREVAPQTYG